MTGDADYWNTCVDHAPRMLDAARRKATTADVGASFVAGDAASPPLPPGEFDVVLARHVLFAMPDPAAAVAAWAELLAPGGRLVLVEGSWHTGVGLTADETTALVRTVRQEAEVEHLSDPVLWGGPLRDERYVVVSTR